MLLHFLFQSFWTDQCVIGGAKWQEMGATCHKVIVSLKRKLLHAFHNFLKPIAKNPSEPYKWPYSNFRTHLAPESRDASVSPFSRQQSTSDYFGGLNNAFHKPHPKISNPLRGCPHYLCFFGLYVCNSIRVYMSFLTFFVGFATASW